MRFPVSLKLIVALSLLFAIGLAAIVLSYRALADVRSSARLLGQHRQPLSDAAHEVEINVNGIGMAVLAYMETPRPAFRDWIAQDRKDIDRALETYLALAASERERALHAAVGRSNAQFLSSVDALLDKSDAHAALLTHFLDRIDHADRTVAEWIRQLGSAAPSSRNSQTVHALLSVEAEMAELGLALIGGRSDSREKVRIRASAKLGELRAAVARLERVPHDAAGLRMAQGVGTLHRELLVLVEQITALEDQLAAAHEQLVAERVQIDRVLDTEIQILARQGIEASLREVELAAESAGQRVGFIVTPLFVGATLVVWWLMYRGVTGPLNRLTSGMRSVARADLEHRIDGMPDDEFGDVAREFNRMTEKLQASAAIRQRLPQAEAELLRKDAELRRRETMAQMGSLVAGVAHEVRNPLFGMTSTLDALQARLHGKSEYQRHITMLRGEATRLQKLMQDLLDYGKPAPAERTPTDLYALIERAQASCAALAQSREVQVVRKFSGAPPQLALDSRGMHQVFVNLLENAVQMSPPGSTVTVVAGHDGLQEEAPAVVCTVGDSGPGFRGGDFGRVFEPFFTRRRGGTGLGLSIVQRIVEAHGGTISAANRAAGGASLTLRLPAPAPVGGSS